MGSSVQETSMSKTQPAPQPPPFSRMPTFLIIQEKICEYPFNDGDESLSNRKVCISTSVESATKITMDIVANHSLVFEDHFLNEEGLSKEEVVKKWILNGNCTLGTMNYGEYLHYLSDRFGTNRIEKQQSFFKWTSTTPDGKTERFGVYISKIEFDVFQYNHFLTDTGYFAPPF